MLKKFFFLLRKYFFLIKLFLNNRCLTHDMYSCYVLVHFLHHTILFNLNFCTRYFYFNFTLKHLLPKREKYILRICTILRVVIAVCTHMIRLGTKLKLPLFRYKTSVYGVLILKSPVYVHTKDVFM